MSATIISEPMAISSQDQSSAAATSAANQTITISISSQIEIEMEIESAKCDCCGLTEECTPAYIDRIRERYMGKWICGLCAEAVKDEVVRSERLISTEEALARHQNVCRKFRSSSPPADSTVHFITAVRQILRRSLECPRGLRSTPASPTRRSGDEIDRPVVLARSGSGSCFPTLSG